MMMDTHLRRLRWPAYRTVYGSKKESKDAESSAVGQGTVGGSQVKGDATLKHGFWERANMIDRLAKFEPPGILVRDDN